jgi:hypothetical protein
VARCSEHDGGPLQIANELLGVEIVVCHIRQSRALAIAESL